MKKILLLLSFNVLVAAFNICVAQTNQNAVELNVFRSLHFFSPDVNSHTGNVVLDGKIWGGELGYKINMANNKADYIRIFNITSIDIAASYRSLRDITIDKDPATKGSLGDTYSVLGRLNIQLLHFGQTKLLFTPGFGIAYATETYFTNGNPLISSHINFAAEAGVKIFTPLSKDLGVQAGVAVFHYSNGAYRVPNNGINAYNVTLGLVKKIESEAPSYDHDAVQTNKSSIEIGADIGRRGVFKSTQGFFKSGMFAAYGYRVSPVLSLKGQFDAIYYYTVFDPNRYDLTNQYFGNSYDKWRTGLSIGADIWLGKLAVTANYGRYLHNHSNYPIKTYWMPGFKYYVLPRLALQAKTYINKGSADFLGAGLVYKVF